MISFTLPAPPSTNQLYNGRRYKTPAYKAWREHAGLLLNLQHPQPVKGAFQLTVLLPGRCDLDNIKAIPDLLKTMSIIEDDRRSLMRRLVVEASGNELVHIRIEPL